MTENIYPWVKYSKAEPLGDPSIWDEQKAEIDPAIIRGPEGITSLINHNTTISGAEFEKDHTVGPLSCFRMPVMRWIPEPSRAGRRRMDGGQTT
ncbi:hypothetical protein CV023_08045 [Brevibacterium sp. CCUG 69071]|nr:hypothetical protein [Brevibacterium sp. CCUG 69071]